MHLLRRDELILLPGQEQDGDGDVGDAVDASPPDLEDDGLDAVQEQGRQEVVREGPQPPTEVLDPQDVDHRADARERVLHDETWGTTRTQAIRGLVRCAGAQWPVGHGK